MPSRHGGDTPSTPTMPPRLSEENTPSPIEQWPSEEEIQRYRQAVSDLAFVKSGKIAEIARRVGCSRQHAQKIIHSTAPFSEKTYKARQIWDLLPLLIEGDEDFQMTKQIIQGFQDGNDVELTTDDSVYANFIHRRLKSLGFSPCVAASKGSKGTSVYLYTHENDGNG